MKQNIWSSACVGILLAAGWNCVQPRIVRAAANSPAAGPAAPASFLTLRTGTTFRVRLLESLDTRRNRPGDRFTASLDEPLVVADRVVVPKNTSFTGHIIQCRSSGRFKGRAVMALQLDSFVLNGQRYSLRSTQSTMSSVGHKMHHLAWIGGGSGGGAMIGAIAGGGVGALIGAGAGAAVGTVGSAITGKLQIRMAAETPLRFTLQAPVTVG